MSAKRGEITEVTSLLPPDHPCSDKVGNSAKSQRVVSKRNLNVDCVKIAEGFVNLASPRSNSVKRHAQLREENAWLVISTK